MFCVSSGPLWDSTAVKALNLEVYQVHEQVKAEDYLGEENEARFEKDRAKK